MSLSTEEKEKAKGMAKNNFTIKQIAKELNTNYNTIYALRKEGVVFVTGKYRVPDETVLKIKTMIARGKTNKEISTELDVKSDYVSSIRHGKIREHIDAPEVPINDWILVLINRVFH